MILIICYILLFFPATIISHNVPPYSRSGLYNELRDIRGLISELQENARSSTESKQEPSDQDGRSDASVILPQIIACVIKAGLFDDLPYRGTFSDPSSASITVENAEVLLSSTDTDTKGKFIAEFSDYAVQLSSYLSQLEQRLFSEGLHVFGGASSASQLNGYLDAICDSTKISEHVLHRVSESSMTGKSTAEILIASVGNNKSHMDENSFAWDLLVGRSKHQNQGILQTIGDFFRYQNLRQLRSLGDKDAEVELSNLVLDKLSSDNAEATSEEKVEILKAVSISQSLAHNHVDEMQGLLSGLSGNYVAAAPGGDLIRDGIQVLPTGRNIYALDPYRIPSVTAFLRGRLAAQLIIKTHQSSNNGAYPETVAVTLWGLDTIKTRGESIGIVLGLVGAEPVREATGRIVSFTLIPLEKLGRPRIDVLAR